MPLRSRRSLAPRAWPTVAAWCIALGVSLSSLACLQTQELGAEDAGSQRIDTGTETIGSTPDAGFSPKLYAVDLDTEKCPAITPTAGTPCPENFKGNDPKTPVQCSYRVTLDPTPGPDDLLRRVCGRSCLCGFDGRWSCMDAPCARPAKRSCAEGMPCLAGVGCGDDAFAKRCTCEHGALSCGKVPTK